MKTWRIRCTKNGTLPDRSVTKNRKKSVAWADEVGGDLECLDKRLEYGQSPNCVLPSPPSSESLDTHKMDIEEDVVMKSPSDSASLSRGKHLPPRLTQSAELFSVGEGKPLASSPSESNLPLPRRFSSPCTDSCSDVSSSTGDRAMDGWNSDVGEFSDPSVNDDSESDSSSGPDGSESDSSSGSDGPESDSSSGSDSPKPIPVRLLFFPWGSIFTYCCYSNRLVSKFASLPGHDRQTMVSRDVPSSIVKQFYHLIIVGSAALAVGHNTAAIKGVAWASKASEMKIISAPKSETTSPARRLSVSLKFHCKISY